MHNNPIIVSNSAIVLASFLCAIVCVLGFMTAFRRCCHCLRRPPVPELPVFNSSLKKKVIESLPKLTFKDKLVTGSPECVICLSEFVIGDEIRVMPPCSHAFHAVCVDEWLRLNASCPSCRRILAGSWCRCNGDLIAVQPVPDFLP